MDVEPLGRLNRPVAFTSWSIIIVEMRERELRKKLRWLFRCRTHRPLNVTLWSSHECCFVDVIGILQSQLLFLVRFCWTSLHSESVWMRTICVDIERWCGLMIVNEWTSVHKGEGKRHNEYSKKTWNVY